MSTSLWVSSPYLTLLRQVQITHHAAKKKVGQQVFATCDSQPDGRPVAMRGHVNLELGRGERLQI